MAEKPSAAPPFVGDPNLDPELRARAESASDVVPVVLAAAARLPQPREDSMAQVYALGLYGSVIEQFSACVLLAQFGEPSTIPIILRSMYEALVDLDNLVHDAKSLIPFTVLLAGCAAMADAPGSDIIGGPNSPGGQVQVLKYYPGVFVRVYSIILEYQACGGHGSG
jgi:hypothetical protein